MALSPGTRLGRYEITGTLGAGGMGAVYRASDTTLRRDVAVKVLHDEFVADPDRLRRFEREALATAALNHPHIIAVYDVGTHDGTAYVVSELLEGRTLQGILATGPLPPARAAAYALQIALGLAAAHEKGIVHRDLKPANLFITADDRIKILDFGIARVDREAGPGSTGTTNTSLTASGMVMGSAGYMAPEQVHGAAVDHRADIFSFGVVLYEMIAGRRAFQRDTAAGTLAAIVESDPPTSTGDGSSQSRRLMRLARRCLEKSPAQRFQSARDLALVLQDETQAERDTAETPVQRPRFRLLTLAGGTAVLVTALAAWTWVSDRTTSSAPAVIATPVSFEISMPDGQRILGRPAISSEARAVAFVAGLGNDANLYIRKFDVPTPRMVEGSRGALQPFFSPDGRRLAYFAGGQLRVASVDDGMSFVVCAVSDPRGGAWGEDDIIVFAPGVATGLSQVMPVAGALPKPLTTLGADELTHRYPVVLPGASAVLFTRQLKSGRTSVAALHAGATAVEMVVDGAMAPRYAGHRLFFVNERSELSAAPFDPATVQLTGAVTVQAERPDLGFNLSDFAYELATDGALAYVPFIAPKRILSIVQPGGASRPIPGPPRAFAEGIAVSPDGQRIAIGIQTNPNAWGDIWVGDQLGSFLPLTRDGVSHSPVWNARGDAVAFESRRSGAAQIIAQAIEGQAEPRVLFRDEAYPGTWLPDGLLVLNAPTQSSRYEIRMLRPGGAQAERVPVSMTGLGRVSPDGHWLAYISGDSGETEVYVTAFPEAGRVWPVSQAGSGRELRWSKSGSELYFRRRTGELMVVSVGANGPVTGPPRSAGVGTFPISTRAGDPYYDTLPGGGFIVIRDVAERPAPAPIVVTLR